MKSIVKKLNLYISCIILFIMVFPTFTACKTDSKQQPHSHNFAWRYDSQNHWLECTCKETKENSAHIFDNKVCKTCGYVIEENLLTHSYRNIAYGSHPLQKMDIHIPNGSTGKNFPVLLTLHGGEWISGDKSDFDAYTDKFVKANCIHVNVNFRLIENGIVSDATPPYEQMLDDIKQALDFLMEHAREYSVDTRKAAIMGYSSGGHLALMYAYTRTLSSIPIDAVISLSGPTNFMDAKTFTEDGELWVHENHGTHTEEISVFPNMTREQRINLIGKISGTAYGTEDWQTEWEKASPAFRAQITSPKTLLLYGTHDNVIPISHAEFLQSKLSDCTFIELLNTNHNVTASTDLNAMKYFQITLNSILSELGK